MEKIWKIDLMIVGITVVALLFLIGYARPLVIAPLNDYESSEGDVLFLIEKADILLIDDNADFTSPEEYSVVDGLGISLEPGKYYWKAVGVLGSEIRTLTINSKINLEFVKIGEDFGVVNSGNVRLNVDVYNDTDLIEKMKLDVGERTEIDEDVGKLVGGMA